MPVFRPTHANENNIVPSVRPPSVRPCLWSSVASLSKTALHWFKRSSIRVTTGFSALPRGPGSYIGAALALARASSGCAVCSVGPDALFRGSNFDIWETRQVTQSGANEVSASQTQQQNLARPFCQRCQETVGLLPARPPRSCRRRGLQSLRQCG